MLNNPLLEFPPLHEGILIKRYKRFLADVKLDNDEIVTAHCPNTGPMTGLVYEGGRVRLRYCPSISRKLDWTWEQSLVPNLEKGSSCWVGVNTLLANKLVRLAIENNYLKDELGEILGIRQEVVYGADRKSRIDFLLTSNNIKSNGKLIYLEVKNTTWVEKNVALFPDTVTTRGQKHLKELMGVMPDSKAVLVPCITRPDITEFAPGDNADPKYGDLFRQAIAAGLVVIPCSFNFFSDHIVWGGTRPVIELQKK